MPRIFPEDPLGWARGIAGRSGLTLGIVGVALSVDSAFARLAVFGSGPIDPSPVAVPEALGTMLVVVPLSWLLPERSPDISLVNCPAETELTTQHRLRSGAILARLPVIVSLRAIFLV